MRHRHQVRAHVFSQEEDSAATPSPESGRAFSPDSRTGGPRVHIDSLSDDDRLRAQDVSEKEFRRKRQQQIPLELSIQQSTTDDFDLDGHLPHIPLRPFRNQVGGHSAIYKFTKRAVCKVSIP